jgi:hypothetical protein
MKLFPGGIFLFTTTSRTALGPTQPPLQWVPGALSVGVKRPGREADHSPPSSAEVKNAWSYTSAPQYVFMAWCLVKHRDNFTFTFTLPHYMFLYGSWIRPSDLLRFGINFWKYVSFHTFWSDSLGGGSAHHKASTYTGQQNREKNKNLIPQAGFIPTILVLEQLRCYDYDILSFPLSLHFYQVKAFRTLLSNIPIMCSLFVWDQVSNAHKTSWIRTFTFKSVCFGGDMKRCIVISRMVPFISRVYSVPNTTRNIICTYCCRPPPPAYLPLPCHPQYRREMSLSCGT